MTTLLELCQLVYDWPPATALRESDDVFPLIETVHVLAICLIVGTVVTVDLRLLGLIMREQPVTQIARTLLPLTWYGFALMFVTGVPLFAAESLELYSNPAFRLKLVLLVIAGCNALLFHRTVYRSVDAWDKHTNTPLGVKAFASVSILLWSGIVVAGRLIAVFHVH
jgi:hypothetical protein